MDDTKADLIAMGAPAELLAEIGEPDKSNEFDVFPENWQAIEIFLAMQTQWVIAGMGSVVGLNYSILDFLFKLFKVKDRKKVFDEIRIIEMGALKVLNEKKE